MAHIEKLLQADEEAREPSHGATLLQLLHSLVQGHVRHCLIEAPTHAQCCCTSAGKIRACSHALALALLCLRCLLKLLERLLLLLWLLKLLLWLLKLLRWLWRLLKLLEGLLMLRLCGWLCMSRWGWDCCGVVEVEVVKEILSSCLACRLRRRHRCTMPLLTARGTKR